jgi:hypothetical protein
MTRKYGNWTILSERFPEGGQGEIYRVTNGTGTPLGIWLLKRLKIRNGMNASHAS